MAVTTDTLRVTGTLRHANDIQPNITRTNLAQQDEEVFAIPLETCLDHSRKANPAGIGITGAAAAFTSSVEKVGSLIKTTILIDLTGLNSGGTANDIIGDDGTGRAHLGQITAAVNGTIVAGRMTCLETPATGDDDIDLYYATEATGVEDTLITDLEEAIVFNSGNLTVGTVVGPPTNLPAADKYLYLVGVTGDADATYTAGVLLIEFWGTDATGYLDVVRGTDGTNPITLQTEDLRSVGATTRSRRYTVVMPPEYVAGQTVKIRAIGGMITTVADGSATVDINCYSNDEDDTLSADLCTTAATTINTLLTSSATTVDFTITSSALSPGTVLDVKVSVTVTDSSTTATAVIGAVTKLALLCDTQG